MRTLENWISFLFENRASSRQENFKEVLALAENLDLTHFNVPVISVTGTNGKGSCVAVLESILIEAGYKVGAYTSPHLFEFNERIRISGRNVSDAPLCEAFTIVEKESLNKSINFFSFITLAALLIFKKEQCDVIILEVGIGGRLDATNVVDNDIVVITTVAKDHCEILGSSIEDIASEKAGLIKKNKAVVFGDEPVPQAIVDRAREMGARLYGGCVALSERSESNGHCFLYKKERSFNSLSLAQDDIKLFRLRYHEWSWQYEKTQYNSLPIPSVLLTNAASALMALTHLCVESPGLGRGGAQKERMDSAAKARKFVDHKVLSISEDNIQKGLSTVFLPCRCQVVPGDVMTLLDVAHNEQAAELLAEKIIELKPKKVCSVFSALGRKDLQALLTPLKPVVDRWFIAPMCDLESATIEHLSQALLGCEVMVCGSIQQAYDSAKNSTEQGDLIVVFGSFRMFQELR